MVCVRPLVAILAWFSSGTVHSVTVWLLSTSGQQTVTSSATGRAQPTGQGADKPRRLPSDFAYRPDPADEVRSKLSQSIVMDAEE